MRRPLTHLSLHVLLSGLLLAMACGDAPEAGLTPSHEPLGTQEAATCSTSSVTTLTITEVSSYGGELAGNGSYAVSFPANAVRLEYYVGGVLKGYDERLGASGTWYFSTTGIGCGSHTFLVKAFPMVIDSLGNRTVCTGTSKSVSRSVTQSCPSASISCSRSSSTHVTCSGSGSGGTGAPYTPNWQQYVESYDGRNNTTPWFQAGGSMSLDLYCQQTTVYDPADWMHIHFYVQDSSGMASPIQSVYYIACEAGTLL